MYKVLIGCNVRLNEGEEWPGTVWTMPDGSREARMEPGDQVERLPEATDVQFLLEAGAIANLTPDPFPTREGESEPISEIRGTGAKALRHSGKAEVTDG